MILASMEILLIVAAVQVFNMLVFVWSRRGVSIPTPQGEVRPRESKPAP